MARIFISYAREDEDKVSALYAKLKDAGFTPWMDIEDIMPGEDWERAILTAISESHFIVACISPHFVGKRGFIQREIKISSERYRDMMPDDILVIPVRLEECPAPEDLRKFQWVDLFRESGWPRLLKALHVGATRRSISIPSPQSRESKDVKEEKPPIRSALSPPPTVRETSLLTYDFTTVTLDARGQIIKRRPGTARYFLEETGGVDLEMVYVPGGEFAMGTNASEATEVRKEIERYWKGGGDWADTELPQHEVTVPPFFIGKFQVTQAQWRTVARWPKVNTDLTLDPSNFKGELSPVEQVSWDDAQEFCARLAKKTGKPYRLPSEAEWEYACRAGTMTPFAFGETITPQIVNYDGNYPYADAKKGEYRSQTVPVGSLNIANAFGLFDMHGNVWEWCQDVWHDSYGGQYRNPPMDGSAWLSGGDSSRRVLRGGSWLVSGGSCRSANRVNGTAGDLDNVFGFRVVVFSRTQ